MVFLYHGQDTVKSREKLFQIREDADVYTLEAKAIKPENLAQLLGSQNLFQDKPKIIIIEKILQDKSTLDNFPAVPDSLTLVFWEDQKLKSPQISLFRNKFPLITVEEFKLSPVVFKFLQSLSPKNQSIHLPLWKKYQAETEPEVALVMLARQIRLLLVAKDDKREENSEWKGLDSWQKSQLFAQAKKFSPEVLYKIHSKLLTIDYQNKTGQLYPDLPSAIELLLLTI